MAKAKITATELASYMGLKKGHGKTLKPLCDAAKDVVTAYSEKELDDSQAAKQAMLLTAAWLGQTGVTDPVEMMTGLPLQVRYFCQLASEGVEG